MSREPVVFGVDTLDLRFVDRPWPYAHEHRAEIDAFFAALQAEKPDIWNGRVLLMHRRVVAEGVFRGEYFETDFASFAAWRAWGWPPAGVINCFGAAAVVSADNAVLLGRMAPHTANAGQIYFPCGTPDADDRDGDRVDLAASVGRELKEETGLDAATLQADPGWTAVLVQGEVAMIKVLRSAENADRLAARVRAFLAAEDKPELDEIIVVRSMNDVTPAMLSLVQAWLEKFFA